MGGMVLITRPEEDAKSIADDIVQKGYGVFLESFLTVVFDGEIIPDISRYSGLIFTSKNGVRAFCAQEKNRDLLVFTVGKNTADEARKVGFLDIKSADGDVSSLSVLLSDYPAKKPYLHIRGEHIARPIQSQNKGVQIEEKVLYHTEKIDKISKECAEIIQKNGLSHVLFFSKRTAESFVSAICTYGLEAGFKRTKALCLGDSMIESLSVLPWDEIIVAARFNRDGMLALLD